MIYGWWKKSCATWVLPNNLNIFEIKPIPKCCRIFAIIRCPWIWPTCPHEFWNIWDGHQGPGKAWMMLRSQTSKPTLCWSNASWIQGLNVGSLKKSTEDEKTSLQPVRTSPRFNWFLEKQLHAKKLARNHHSSFSQMIEASTMESGGTHRFVGTGDLKKTAFDT